MVAELNEQDFESTLAASHGPVLVDFAAVWCHPCRIQAPVIESLAAESAGRYAVYTLDVDRAPAIARRYGVRSVPTLIVFRDGEERQRLTGYQSAATLRAALDAAAASPATAAEAT
ncbi:MAG TPA: thioredoxin [Kiloniellales bacterium]|nr:thioredoxin [Kiloniellales bacterium]